MRGWFVLVCGVGLMAVGWAQNPEMPTAVPSAGSSKTAGEKQPANHGSGDSALKDMFEEKIKLEWEALKNKDKKAYGALLADDYQGVEIDARGERNKIQSVNDLDEENVFNYTLWGYKFFPLGPDAALIIYESTMQFPPKAQIRFSRVYISEIWVKRAGEWKILHYQETRVK
ncbi:MAG: nuclear transport factor 2 family protein [Terriglobales bacterium]